jgi:hypothetical protein
LAGIVKGCCRALQIPSSGQSDETISQVLSLKQNEDHESHDYPRGRQWVDQRSDQPDDDLKCTWIGLPQFHGDRPGPVTRRRESGSARWAVHLLAQILQDLRGTFERAASSTGASQSLDFVA